jgi:hypothetical protein
MSPAELVDLPILIEVLNSKKMRSDCLIGSFKFDVGEVFIHTGQNGSLLDYSLCCCSCFNKDPVQIVEIL